MGRGSRLTGPTIANGRPIEAAMARASAAMREGRTTEATLLLRQLIAAVPNPDPIRLTLANHLRTAGEPVEALAELDRLVGPTRAGVPARTTRATLLVKLGRHQEALPIFERNALELPRESEFWASYGAVLRIVGRLDDAIAAYRHAISVRPQSGAAWWGLANLKTFRFAAADLAAMRRALRTSKLGPADAAGIHFAIGQALADQGDAKASFDQYAKGNRLIAATLRPGAGRVTERVDRLMAHFDAALFERLGGRGHPSDAPIFIVGMHRAGSTLAEQILASHSAVEGTAELAVLPRLWRGLGRDPLAALETADLAALGADYLERTAPYRREDGPRFVDKQPDNWLHIGFIRLILPNATIIDARRHPMATGFSIYRQLFAAGAAFAYDLSTIGRFYADYARLMDHYDRVQPGAVHRLIYDRLVENPEMEIRRLLDAADLPFEEACLNFHSNQRAVATPSAQQVRRPINRDGLDAWRPFEPWLGPLRDALGDTLESWDRPA